MISLLLRTIARASNPARIKLLQTSCAVACGRDILRIIFQICSVSPRVMDSLFTLDRRARHITININQATIAPLDSRMGSCIGSGPSGSGSNVGGLKSFVKLVNRVSNSPDSSRRRFDLKTWRIPGNSMLKKWFHRSRLAEIWNVESTIILFVSLCFKNRSQRWERQ